MASSNATARGDVAGTIRGRDLFASENRVLAKYSIVAINVYDRLVGTYNRNGGPTRAIVVRFLIYIIIFIVDPLRTLRMDFFKFLSAVC